MCRLSRNERRAGYRMFAVPQCFSHTLLDESFAQGLDSNGTRK